MRRETLELVKPVVTFRAAMLSMIDEYKAAGEDLYQGVVDLAWRDFSAYVRQLEEMDQGIGLLPGWVPQTTYWMVRDNTFIIGTTRLRHHLTAALRREGGHIGYTIRPSERGKGYGTRQLALTLQKAREFGLKRVLVTCDLDNVASARVIEKNGGALSSRGISAISGKCVSRYWIELPEDNPCQIPD